MGLYTLDVTFIFNRVRVASALNPRRTLVANLRFNRLVCLDDTKEQIEWECRASGRRDKQLSVAYITLYKSVFFKSVFGLVRRFKIIEFVHKTRSNRVN